MELFSKILFWIGIAFSAIAVIACISSIFTTISCHELKAYASVSIAFLLVAIAVKMIFV